MAVKAAVAVAGLRRRVGGACEELLNLVILFNSLATKIWWLRVQLPW